MDIVDTKRLIWAVGATVVTSLGLTLGSAVLAENADARHESKARNAHGFGCEPFSNGFFHSNGKCYHGPAL